MQIQNSIFQEEQSGKLWNHLAPELIASKPRVLEQEFYYSSSKKSQFDKLKKLTFSLVDCYLVKNKQQNNIRWMNMNNVLMRKMNDDQMGAGIVFQKNGKEFILYGETDFLYDCLKKYSVQTNFIAQYKVLKKIGSGKFGQVFLCQNRITKVKYAVKCYDKKSNSDLIDVECTLKEINIIRKLNHENVLQFEELFECDKKIYIIMQLYAGGNLQEYLESHYPIQEKDVCQIVHQLLLAVSYIHSKKIMHRDIKPDNIMFKEKGDISKLSLADFGLADYYNVTHQYLCTRCGTPGFVAPEILQDKIYDYKIDIYSIGIVMYYISSGVLPFSGHDYDDTVMQNFLGRVNFDLLDLSSEGMEFIRKMLEVNVRQRFSTQEALKHVWFQKFGFQTPIKEPLQIYLNPKQLNKTNINLNFNESISVGSGESPLLSPMISQRRSVLVKKSNFIIKQNPQKDYDNCEYSSNESYFPNINSKSSFINSPSSYVTTKASPFSPQVSSKKSSAFNTPNQKLEKLPHCVHRQGARNITSRKALTPFKL